MVDSGSYLQNGLRCVLRETKLLSCRRKVFGDSIGVENREDAAGYLDEVRVNCKRVGVFQVIQNSVAAVFGLGEEAAVVAFAFGHDFEEGAHHEAVQLELAGHLIDNAHLLFFGDEARAHDCADVSVGSGESQDHEVYDVIVHGAEVHLKFVQRFLEPVLFDLQHAKITERDFKHFNEGEKVSWNGVIRVAMLV